MLQLKIRERESANGDEKVRKKKKRMSFVSLSYRMCKVILLFEYDMMVLAWGRSVSNWWERAFDAFQSQWTFIIDIYYSQPFKFVQDYSQACVNLSEIRILSAKCVCLSMWNFDSYENLSLLHPHLLVPLTNLTKTREIIRASFLYVAVLYYLIWRH